MGLCDDLLAQKKTLSVQINDIDTDLANQWLTCLALDALPLTGGPAASNTLNDVQLRIDELTQVYYGTTDPNVRTAALNAINAYTTDYDLLRQRAETQSELNNVVLQLLQNNCPLE